MPCNRRNMNCGGPGSRFHPYASHFHSMHPWLTHMHQVAEEEIAQALFVKDRQKATTRWTETDSAYCFEMDLPGVKAQHVTVEESHGEIEVTAVCLLLSPQDQDQEKTFQEVFYVSPKKGDLENVMATLQDGVLRITIPKKPNIEHPPLEITVQAGTTPPAALEEGHEFRVTIDLPGVKSRDLSLRVLRNNDDDDVFSKVVLEASRTVGEGYHSTGRKIRRMFKIDPPTADMNFAQAFLQDGVFILVAPVVTEQKEEDEDDVNSSENMKPSAVNVISVLQAEEEEEEEEEGIAAEAAMGSLSLEEEGKGNETKNGDDMVVETVEGQAKQEEEEWEAVQN